jgi:FlgD Ig-like domain
MHHRFTVLCALVASMLPPVAATAAPPSHIWSQGYGDAASQSARALAIDALGNIVVTGEFSGVIDFGDAPLTSAGGTDIFLTRHRPNGNVHLSRSFGDASGQRAADAAVAPDGSTFLTGSFSGSIDFGGDALASAGSNDVFVAGFDSNLVHVWSKRFGDGDGQYPSGIALDGASGLYVGGYFSGSIDFGGGPLLASGFDDVFLVKFNSTGLHLWSKRFGNSSAQEALDVAVDPAGNVLIVGQFLGSINFGGANLTSLGVDVFVAKLDPGGAHLWSKRFGSTLSQSAQAVATDADGNVYLAGTFKNAIDFGGGPLTSAGEDDVFLAKLDAAGNHLWSKRFGDASAGQAAKSIAVDPTQRVSIGGYFRGSADFGQGALTSAGLEDGFVAQFTAAGDGEWSARYGDGATQSVEAVVADVGDRLLAGKFAGAIDFGGGALTSAGADDAFLTRLNAWTPTSASPTRSGAASIRAFPNPFNPSTTLEASIPQGGHVTVSIHDARGRRVAMVFDGVLPAGATALHWEGMTDSGASATSGVYFACLEFPSGTISRKLVLLK